MIANDYRAYFTININNYEHSIQMYDSGTDLFVGKCYLSMNVGHAHYYSSGERRDIEGFEGWDATWGMINGG